MRPVRVAAARPRVHHRVRLVRRVRRRDAVDGGQPAARVPVAAGVSTVGVRAAAAAVVACGAAGDGMGGVHGDERRRDGFDAAA